MHYDLALAYDHNKNTAAATEEVSKALTLGLPDAQRQDAENLSQRLRSSPSTAKTGAEAEPPERSAAEISAWLSGFVRDYGHNEGRMGVGFGTTIDDFSKSLISFPNDPCKATVTNEESTTVHSTEEFEVDFSSLAEVSGFAWGLSLKGRHTIPRISCKENLVVQRKDDRPPSCADARNDKSDLRIFLDTESDSNRATQAVKDLKRVCASKNPRDIY